MLTNAGDQTNRPRCSQHKGLTMPYQHGRPNQKPCGLACGIPYQTLPRVSISCARGAKPIGAFGLVMDPLPMLTKAPFWLCRHSLVLLPIITGRGVKYTHNDIKHLILHPDSGPRGIRLVPTEHTHEAIAPPHPHDPQSILGQGPTWLQPRPRQSLLATANTVAKQVNLVMIS